MFKQNKLKPVQLMFWFKVKHFSILEAFLSYAACVLRQHLFIYLFIFVFQHYEKKKKKGKKLCAALGSQTTLLNNIVNLEMHFSTTP